MTTGKANAANDIGDCGLGWIGARCFAGRGSKLVQCGAASTHLFGGTEMRRAFEAWAKSHTALKLNHERDWSYLYVDARTAWEAWQAATAAEREACANVCEEIESERWALYKGRSPYNGREEGRADPHIQGMSDGAAACEAAIRARG